MHLNDDSVKSCTLLAVQANGCSITTIEGMATDDELHPLQEAFRQEHGLQCGFCTPGMIMSSADLIKRNHSPTDEQIREWLEGNLCRCTGYHNIVKAVQHGAKLLRSNRAPKEDASGDLGAPTGASEQAGEVGA